MLVEHTGALGGVPRETQRDDRRGSELDQRLAGLGDLEQDASPHVGRATLCAQRDRAALLDEGEPRRGTGARDRDVGESQSAARGFMRRAYDDVVRIRRLRWRWGGAPGALEHLVEVLSLEARDARRLREVAAGAAQQIRAVLALEAREQGVLGVVVRHVGARERLGLGGVSARSTTGIG